MTEGMGAVMAAPNGWTGTGANGAMGGTAVVSPKTTGWLAANTSLGTTGGFDAASGTTGNGTSAGIGTALPTAPLPGSTVAVGTTAVGADEAVAAMGVGVGWGVDAESAGIVVTAGAGESVDARGLTLGRGVSAGRGEALGLGGTDGAGATFSAAG